MKKILAIAALFVMLSCEHEPKIALQPQQPALTAGPDTSAYTYNGEGHTPKEYTYIDTSLPFKTIPVKPNTNAGVPFNTLDYDNVVAYDYEATYSNDEALGVGPLIIDEDNKLHPAVIKRAALTQQQADAITTLLTDKKIYSDAAASCFEPRFGLVFYKGKEVVMHVSICLACDRLRSSIPILDDQISFNEKGGDRVGTFAKSLGFR